MCLNVAGTCTSYTGICQVLIKSLAIGENTTYDFTYEFNGTNSTFSHNIDAPQNDFNFLLYGLPTVLAIGVVTILIIARHLYRKASEKKQAAQALAVQTPDEMPQDHEQMTIMNQQAQIIQEEEQKKRRNLQKYQVFTEVGTETNCNFDLLFFALQRMDMLSEVVSYYISADHALTKEEAQRAEDNGQQFKIHVLSKQKDDILTFSSV